MKKLIYLPLFLLIFSCGDDTEETPTSSTEFAITSEAIVNGELLDDFKCEAKTDNIENSIPLAWKNVPEGTASLAIIMYHFPNASDQTQANSYLHLWNIDPSVTSIPYGTADNGAWYIGSNKDGNAISYTSPCSPSAGSHEYTIKIFALSEAPASLPTESSLSVDYDVFLAAMQTVTTVGTASLTFNDVN